MNIQRRLLLKSMILGSIAGLGLTGSAQSAQLVSSEMSLAREQSVTGQPKPILALVNERTKYSAFLQGVQASGGANRLQIYDADLGLDFLLTLQQRIQSLQEGFIIGLVDNAEGTLILDLARAAGIRTHWLGQHTVSDKQSRHQLLTSKVNGERELLFRRQLAERGLAINFDRQQTKEKWASCRFITHVRADSINNQQWAADLGFVLAHTGLATSSTVPQVAVGLPSLIGHFVSFVFEI